ncbi:MAG TPA: hypothetical protein VN964_02175 [Gemmatimonadales bacterium]|nr:hypothetical protein [Gemmatimonadales bacterium]
MISSYGVVATVLLWTAQGTPLDGTWLLTRIFRAGTPAGTRAVPLDSTVYIRISLESHTGGWFTGWLYRRYFGQPERTKLGGGPLRGTGRWILGADFDHPVSQEAKTAAWLVGDTLRLGTPFVPDADSLEFRRAAPNAPDPTTVLEVVTSP